jgi:hypothetical protein
VDSQAIIVVVAAAVLVLVGIGLYAYQSRRRRDELRNRFGPEYDRTVQAAGSPAEADAILAKRVERVTRFKLHPLNQAQRDSFTREWQRVQARFVDNPDAAVGEADQLVAQVMAARGYPVQEFERLADDVSVDHPHVVENYRTARALMQRRANGEASTEELRQAVVNYRALFNDLLEDEPHRHRRAS